MKEKFIEKLNHLLAPLDPSERKAIIDFYEERFHTGMVYEGKSESEIIDELERPEDIARNVLREYGFNYPKDEVTKMNEERKSTSPWRVLWIILFDVFMVAWIVPALFGVLVGLASAWFGVVSGLLAAALLEMSTMSIFNLVFVVGFGFLWFLLILWVYDLFVSFLAWLVRWHADVFAIKEGRSLVRFLNRIKASTVIRRRPKLYRFKNAFKGVALFMLLIGGGGLIIMQGSVALKGDDERIQHEETLMPATMDGWVIETMLDSGHVTVQRHTGDDIRVEANVFERFENEIDIDEDEKTIYVKNESTISIVFSFNWIRTMFMEPDEVIIFLPENLTIDDVDVSSRNGGYTMRDFQLSNLKVRTSNGNLLLENIEAVETIDMETSNGRITLNTINAVEITSRTSNGRVNVTDLEADDIILRTSNGSITVRGANSQNKDGQTFFARTSNGSVDVEEVYFKEVELRTSNGNIDYHNTDLTFIVENLTTSTSNGSVNKNVPSH